MVWRQAFSLFWWNGAFLTVTDVNARYLNFFCLNLPLHPTCFICHNIEEETCTNEVALPLDIRTLWYKNHANEENRINACDRPSNYENIKEEFASAVRWLPSSIDQLETCLILLSIRVEEYQCTPQWPSRFQN